MVADRGVEVGVRARTKSHHADMCEVHAERCSLPRVHHATHAYSHDLLSHRVHPLMY